MQEKMLKKCKQTMQKKYKFKLLVKKIRCKNNILLVIIVPDTLVEIVNNFLNVESKGLW